MSSSWVGLLPPLFLRYVNVYLGGGVQESASRRSHRSIHHKSKLPRARAPRASVSLVSLVSLERWKTISNLIPTIGADRHRQWEGGNGSVACGLEGRC